MKYKDLRELCKDYVAGLFSKRSDDSLVFHNYAHTERVVARADQISLYYHLEEPHHFVVIAAGWFHDVGYLFEDRRAHEEIGAEIASDFLEKQGVEDKLVTQIVNCILATSVPQQPNGILQAILCDADLFHLGTPEFFARDRFMHVETEIRTAAKIPEQKWVSNTISFLEAHQYHTTYCQLLLERSKLENLQKLRAKFEEMSP